MTAARQELALPTARALLGVADLPSRDVGSTAAAAAGGGGGGTSYSEEGHFTDVERRHVLAWVLLLCRFLTPDQLAHIGTAKKRTKSKMGSVLPHQPHTSR
jgi:hypothetical protein